MSCPLCGGRELETVFRYDRPPAGETPFGLDEYEREYRRCSLCGHFLSVTSIDLDELYSGAYVDATYSADGIASTYERIMSLPPERSDNLQRVARITQRLGDRGKLLDVGSGLAVFPARMQEAGWDCTALDPDPRAVEHARTAAAVEAVCADFMQAGGLGSFDLVTLNKVLEHVPEPVTMLARVREFVAANGRVYIELPDGEAAATDPDGPNREEFFIEHLHVFSMSSMSLLADRAGLTTLHAERIREPSGKYTLFAFLSCAAG
jgi:SAM-dependent methyltransferase